MDPIDQERYSRQIKLPQVGIDGQEQLSASRALIIGMGGLGSPVALYLASAGVGHLTITDFDRVDESNLQRQVIHNLDSVGELKAASAQRSIENLNPRCAVEALDYELEDEELLQQVGEADVVLDCTDNFPSRFALNEACIAMGTPLVSGAAIRWEGQIATFDPQDPDCPCYRCLYPDTGVEAVTCAMEGVIAPIVGVIGTMQALAAVRLVLGIGGRQTGKLLLFDGRYGSFMEISTSRRAGCTCCGA